MPLQATARNMQSVRLHPEIVMDYPSAELSEGRVLRPFPPGIIPGLHLNRLGGPPHLPQPHVPGEPAVVGDVPRNSQNSNRLETLLQPWPRGRTYLSGLNDVLLHVWGLSPVPRVRGNAMLFRDVAGVVPSTVRTYLTARSYGIAELSSRSRSRTGSGGSSPSQISRQSS